MGDEKTFKPMTSSQFDEYIRLLQRDSDADPVNQFHTGSGSGLGKTNPAEGSLAWYRNQLDKTPEKEWSADHYMAKLYEMICEKDSKTKRLMGTKENYNLATGVVTSGERSAYAPSFASLIPGMYDSPRPKKTGDELYYTAMTKSSVGVNCGVNQFYKSICAIKDELWLENPDTAYVVANILCKLNLPIPIPQGQVGDFEDEAKLCQNSLDGRAGEPQTVAMLLRLYAAGDGADNDDRDTFLYPYQEHSDYENPLKDHYRSMLQYANPFVQAARMGKYQRDPQLMAYLGSEQALAAAKSGRLREGYAEFVSMSKPPEPEKTDAQKIEPKPVELTAEQLRDRVDDLKEMLTAFALPTENLKDIDVKKYKIDGSAEYQKMARALLAAMQDAEIGGKYDAKHDKTIRDACAAYCLAKPTVRKTQSGRDRFNRALNLMMAVSANDDPTVVDCFGKINAARGFPKNVPNPNVPNYVVPERFDFEARHVERRAKRQMELIRDADEASKREFQKFFNSSIDQSWKAKQWVDELQKKSETAFTDAEKAGSEPEKVKHRLTAMRSMAMAQIIMRNNPKNATAIYEDVLKSTEEFIQSNDLAYSVTDANLSTPEDKARMFRTLGALSADYLDQKNELYNNVVAENKIDAIIERLSEENLEQTAKNPEGLHTVERGLKNIIEIYGRKPVFHEEYAKNRSYTKEQFDHLMPYDIEDAQLALNDKSFTAVCVMAALNKDISGHYVFTNEGPEDIGAEKACSQLASGNSNMYITDLTRDDGPRSASGKSFEKIGQPAREAAYNAILAYKDGNMEPLAKLIVEGVKTTLYYSKHAQLPRELNRETSCVDSLARVAVGVLRRSNPLKAKAKELGLGERDIHFLRALEEMEKLGRANDRALDLLGSGEKLDEVTRRACITAVLRHRGLAEVCRKKEELCSQKVNDAFYGAPGRMEEMDELSDKAKQGDKEAARENALLIQRDITGEGAHAGAFQTEYFDYLEMGGAYADTLAKRLGVNVDALMKVEDTKKLAEILKDEKLYTASLRRIDKEGSGYEQYLVAPEPAAPKAGGMGMK